MTIDRITKIMYINTCSYNSVTGTQKLVTVSLPRVKWLERDGEVKPAEVEVKEVVVEKSKRIPSYLVGPLTFQENRVHQMWLNGMSTESISESLKVSKNTVKGTLYRAKQKTKTLNAKKEEENG